MSPAHRSIPVLDLAPEIEEHWDELNAAFQRVLRSGQFILGPEVEAFEREAAAFLGVTHAIGVNSGTDALVIALRALGIGPGDEVVTSPFSFFATAESIGNVGATPVFVDIDERTFNLDPDLIESALSERTKAIMPVHLYGRPCEMGAVLEIAERHALSVIEDCAQSFGATIDGQQTGTLGNAGAFSFFPSKNLGAFGDAGLIATDDAEVAGLARMLRAHGGRHKYHNEMLGYNSRLDALQAALLRVRLRHVERSNAERRRVAERYEALLADAPGLITPELAPGHVFHQYTVRLTRAERDAVRQRLEGDGIGTMVYYPVPQDQLPVYGGRYAPLPVSTMVAGQVLSLPIWPTLSIERQEQVAEALRRAASDGGVPSGAA